MFVNLSCSLHGVRFNLLFFYFIFSFQANNARKRFMSVDGDHITFINVLRLYIQEAEEAGADKDEGTSSNSNANENKKAFKRIRSWCSSNYINARSLRRAVDIQK